MSTICFPCEQCLIFLNEQISIQCLKKIKIKKIKIQCGTNYKINENMIL